MLHKNICFKMLIYIFCISMPVGNFNFRFPIESYELKQLRQLKSIELSQLFQDA